MTLNLMQNRNPFDFSMLGLGGDPQAQGQGAPAGASQGAPGAQQQPPQDQAAGTYSSFLRSFGSMGHLVREDSDQPVRLLNRI